jgi:hypothetical protein
MILSISESSRILYLRIIKERRRDVVAKERSRPFGVVPNQGVGWHVNVPDLDFESSADRRMDLIPSESVFGRTASLPSLITTADVPSRAQEAASCGPGILLVEKRLPLLLQTVQYLNALSMDG